MYRNMDNQNQIFISSGFEEFCEIMSTIWRTNLLESENGFKSFTYIGGDDKSIVGLDFKMSSLWFFCRQKENIVVVFFWINNIVVFRIA